MTRAILFAALAAGCVAHAPPPAVSSSSPVASSSPAPTDASGSWYCWKSHSDEGGDTSGCERALTDCAEIGQRMVDDETTVTPCAPASLAYCFHYVPNDDDGSGIDSCAITMDECASARDYVDSVKDDADEGIMSGTTITDCVERQ